MVRTRVCTVYIVNERMGSPTFWGSSTEMEKTGGMSFLPLICILDIFYIHIY